MVTVDNFGQLAPNAPPYHVLQPYRFTLAPGSTVNMRTASTGLAPLLVEVDIFFSMLDAMRRNKE